VAQQTSRDGGTRFRATTRWRERRGNAREPAPGAPSRSGPRPWATFRTRSGRRRRRLRRPFRPGAQGLLRQGVRRARAALARVRPRDHV